MSTERRDAIGIDLVQRNTAVHGETREVGAPKSRRGKYIHRPDQVKCGIADCFPTGVASTMDHALRKLSSVHLKDAVSRIANGSSLSGSSAPSKFAHSPAIQFHSLKRVDSRGESSFSIRDHSIDTSVGGDVEY